LEVEHVDDPRTAGLEARIADLERRLRGGERRESMETAFWALMHNVFPDETRKHMKAAGREQLLAARSYLDHWIAKLEARTPPAEPARKETIEVE
jgi:BMFP domain-containing protein YqiC